MKERILLQENGGIGSVLLILLIVLAVFFIVHFCGWGPIQNFFAYIMKHLLDPAEVAI
ncbi:MAG: hypothetical protein M1161_02850 [Candidatus Thermoplasmatota archaeon]|nr:hypothetical protein [Candidatus Thermoplasmatota archaeon]